MSERTFSYSNTIQRAYPAFWEALYWGLTRAKVPFQIGDTDLDLPALSRYRILFLPTFDYMSEDLQQKMLDYVNGGGTAVIGPEIPYLDSDMRGFTKLSDAANLRAMSTRPPIVGLHDSIRIENKEVLLGSRKAGRIVPYGDGNFIYMGVTFAPVTSRYDATEAEDVVSKIAQSLEVQPVGDLRAPDVDEVYWGVRAPRLIFLANSSNQPQSDGVQIAQRAQLRDGWTGEKLAKRGPQEIALQPFGIRILEVIR